MEDLFQRETPVVMGCDSNANNKIWEAQRRTKEVKSFDSQ